jgi:hypothetical protein
VFPNDPKTVIFLCFEERQQDTHSIRVPKATAFFVLVPCENDQGLSFTYVVTARHVLEESGSSNVFLRVNTSSGSFEDIQTHRDEWWTHDTQDVAATRFTPKQGIDLDYSHIPLHGFVGPNYEYAEKPFDQLPIAVEVGNEVFFLGLFNQQAGKQQNLPIARFGHISRMPSAITMERHGGTGTWTIGAYLAECHSWGGHSGSPVFWRRPMVQQGTLQSPQMHVVNYAAIGHFQAFLGLMSGHFDIPVKAKTTGDIVGEIRTGVNAGIGVITPAHSIKELLLREDVTEERERHSRAIRGCEPPH